jgi:hypothetical protein
MYSITLVFTRHEVCGFCNSDELYKIIESIGPEIIFEEIPPSYFDKYYVAKIRRNLESDTINKYIENHNIEHVPVDSENVPSESFFNDLQYLHKRIEGLSDINGYNYRNFSDSYSVNARMYGFAYLNSIHCSNTQSEINNAIAKGVQKLNEKKLLQTLNHWKKVNDGRENEMINNIYNYSKENQYSRAVFLIGSAHRNSVMQKITIYETKEKLKLNWGLYNNI